MRYAKRQEFRRIMNLREAQNCLKEPHIVEPMVPVDKHGCYVFTLERITAGRRVLVEVALDDTGPVSRIYVLNVR